MNSDFFAYTLLGPSIGAIVVPALLSVAVVLVLATLNVALFYTANVKNAVVVATYECGFIPFVGRRFTYSIHFYIVAILFIIFDLEVLLLFPWAVSLLTLSLSGYYSMVAFFAILTVGLAYELKSGVLHI